MAMMIFFAPLIGALICGFGWRIIGEEAGQIIATALLFLGALLSWVIFLSFDGTLQQIVILRWIESGSFSARSSRVFLAVPLARVPPRSSRRRSL